jgi:hypothetical protein
MERPATAAYASRRRRFSLPQSRDHSSAQRIHGTIAFDGTRLR